MEHLQLQMVEYLDHYYLLQFLNGTQVGILGMHTIQTRPVAIDAERMENRPMMYVALSYDHRVIDGKEAVGFLVTVKKLVRKSRRSTITRLISKEVYRVDGVHR